MKNPGVGKALTTPGFREGPIGFGPSLCFYSLGQCRTIPECSGRFPGVPGRSSFRLAALRSIPHFKAMQPATPFQAAASEEWAALRCQSVVTLALASDLSAQGIPGWSPSHRVRVRLPRGRRTELRTLPLLPSFVFVPFAVADHAVDLGRSGRVARNRPFLFNGDRPALPVDQLLAMQSLGPAKKVEQFKPGEPVRFVVGPFHGKAATILSPRGRDRWLVEVDRRRVTVPSFLIRSEIVSITTS